MNKSWLIRPFKYFSTFKDLGLIGIGWSKIGNLASKSKNELKTILATSPYELDGLELGITCATINLFVNEMAIGDLVLMAFNECNILRCHKKRLLFR